MGLNTKLSKTYVSRCLVGIAGITYKYQGLRMFALPWDAIEIGTGATESTIAIGKLNENLIKRTEFLLKKARNGKECGNCNYNLTLINRCYPGIIFIILHCIIIVVVIVNTIIIIIRQNIGCIS